jgi:predicted nucleotidyltransferase component of viral defense system
MPGNKTRVVLREYLQVLILKELYRLEAGKKFFFTGGTYLRLVHRAKRFSEDLDFNAARLTKTEFEGTLKKVVSSIKKEGLESRLEFDHWQNLWVARVVFPAIESFYGVVSKYSRKEGILIKVEVNRPGWKIKPETLMVSGFGQMYPVVCTQRGALFADKIDALIKKNRARHLFDIMFMLTQKYPMDEQVLKALGIKGPPLEAILKRVQSFSQAELKHQAETLQPFLFDENEAQLLVHAKIIVPQLIKQYS